MSGSAGQLVESVTGAQALVRALESLGVKTVFGYPGGAIMPVYDALVDSKLEHILARNEQGAALAAGGDARVTREVGVCLATSGPGATNLVTGIADAFLDSIPLVAITGQVSSQVMGTDAFQEIDIFGITLPIVKHSFVVRETDDVEAIVRRAFEIARSGRPGPVLIDFPKDVATRHVAQREGATRADVDPSCASSVQLLATGSLSSASVERAASMMAAARRPVVYAGGGVSRSGALPAFRDFVRELGAPVVTTLHGIGSLPSGHPLLLGMLGMHGTRAANVAVQQSDLLVCLGARFDDRATGKLAEFAPHAEVIHVDVDGAELGKLRRAQLAIRADVQDFFRAVEVRAPEIDAWRDSCLDQRERHAFRYDAPGEGVYAPAFLRELTERDPKRWIVTCDVGQHQMWVAQHARFDEPWQHVSSGGLGTMGFGVPAAIGASLARPGRDVVAVSGDGSFLMNVQELATIHRYSIPVKIVVLDNSGLGLVRQWQSLFYQERYSEVDLSDNPDFVEVARAFGISAMRCARREDVAAAIDALEGSSGPFLLHVPIDAKANVWPLVPPNCANDHMLEEESCTSA